MRQRPALFVAIVVAMTAVTDLARADGLQGASSSGLGFELAFDREASSRPRLDGFGASYGNDDHRFGARVDTDGRVAARHVTRSGLGWATTVADDRQQLELRFNHRF